MASIPPFCSLSFTPVESTLGGALIGLSAAALLLGYGRVLGFSGILLNGTAPFLKGNGDTHAGWRLLVLIGLIGGGVGSSYFAPFPSPTIDYPLWAYATIGMVAGFGTACGNGCTSGHGICGLGRLSPRSFVAVCTFCAAAAATATSLIATVDGGCEASGAPWLAPLALPADPGPMLVGACVPTTIMVVLFVVLRKMADGFVSELLHAFLALSVGCTSGVGLVLAGMLNQHKVRAFLNLGGVWDPSLAFVMGSGVAVSLVAHQLAQRRMPDAPLLAAAYAYPVTCEFGTAGPGTGSILDAKLLLGAALFGIGWGTLGICPGPSVVGLALPLVGASAPWRFPCFVAASVVGMELGEIYKGPATKPTHVKPAAPAAAPMM